MVQLGQFMENTKVWRGLSYFFLSLAALVIVVSGGGVMLGDAIPSRLGSMSRLFREHVVFSTSIIVVAIGGYLFSIRIAAILSRGAWVSQTIPLVKRELRDESVAEFFVRLTEERLRRLCLSLFRPEWPALLLGATSAVGAVTLYYWLASPIESDVSERFLTLWQLQAGLVSVALPILIFIIQYSGAETTARRSKTQALVHYTRVFPILVILVGVLVAYAAGTEWQGPYVFAVGLGMFVGSVALTIYAFLRLLHFAYHPESLERAGVSLLKRRFEEDLESTVEERIGANLVHKAMRSVGGMHTVYFPDSEKYMSIRAKDTGKIDDVHLGNLRGLVNSLSASTMGNLQAAEQDIGIDRVGERDAENDERPDVVFTKVYGDTVTERDRSVLHLRRGAFAELERDQLEQELNGVIRIEGREE